MAGGGRNNANAALAAALASGKTVAEAAGIAGVAERTARRRWANPTFRSRVSKLQADMVGRSLGKMADGMAEAAGRLRELLSAESETVALGAARTMLEMGVKLRETVELERRIQALEAMPLGKAP